MQNKKTQNSNTFTISTKLDLKIQPQAAKQSSQPGGIWTRAFSSFKKRSMNSDRLKQTKKGQHYNLTWKMTILIFFLNYMDNIN